MALLIVTMSCGSATEESRFGGRVVRRTPGGTPPSSTAQVTDTAPTYPVVLKNMSCPFASESAHGLNVECRSLEVPMTRTNPTGPKVNLAVAIIHSTSPTPSPDPVLYLSGGPGGPALSEIDHWTQPASVILEHRDLILLDQRGTGYSEPELKCTNLSEDEDFSSFTPVWAEECVRILNSVIGVDLGSFNTTENAADVADLRRALKLESWNLFGISYGTELALWTMKNHPEGIRSVVIDSVLPPGQPFFDTIGANFERAIRAVSADCAADPRCNAAHPDLEGQVHTAIDSLNDRSKGMGDAWASELFHALYVSALMPDIPKAISLAAHGEINASIRLFEGEGAIRRNPDDYKDHPPESAITRPSLSEILYDSVVCAEAAPLTSPTALRAAYATVTPQIGKPLLEDYLSILALCNVWSVPARPLSPVDSDIPTLVLAGTYDPITPPEWAASAAARLTRSKFVTITGSGHAVWAFGPCPKQLVTAFFDDPAAPGPDCTVGPPAFEV